jgi:tRNA dimethylallyltransferase
MQKTLAVVAGPTAVGKTPAGILLAQHFDTEILSADSRQIYRETTIGTAVPSPGERRQVRHHFVQTIPLEETYNASRYEHQALERLETLFQSQDLVFMVGGSGLYIDAVCQGIDDLPPSDPVIRARLREEWEREGLQTLAGKLRELDPESHSRIDLKNPLRVLKALEVTEQTGRPYSTFLTRKPKERPFRILRLALDRDREELYGRINRRVDQMMEDGLLEEARTLFSRRGLTALKTVGYRELFRHLDGELPLEEAVDLIRRNTRKFARKQLTWFRKGSRYTWFHPDQLREMIRWIEAERNRPDQKPD